MMDYWQEITLPWEERERRMKTAANKRAQEVMDSIIGGEMVPKPKVEEDNTKSGLANPLDRFLGLGLSEDMLKQKQKGN